VTGPATTLAILVPQEEEGEMEDPGPESVLLLGEGGEQGAQSSPASLLCPSRGLLLELEPMLHCQESAALTVKTESSREQARKHSPCLIWSCLPSHKAPLL
jgi:hypothetical protein